MSATNTKTWSPRYRFAQHTAKRYIPSQILIHILTSCLNAADDETRQPNLLFSSNQHPTSSWGPEQEPPCRSPLHRPSKTQRSPSQIWHGDRLVGFRAMMRLCRRSHEGENTLAKSRESDLPMRQKVTFCTVRSRQAAPCSPGRELRQLNMRKSRDIPILSIRPSSFFLLRLLAS